MLKRYVAQLNQQEDQLATLTRDRDDLVNQILRAQAELSQLIDALSVDLDLYRRYFASGSGRSWKCITLLVVPRPVSMWNGARVLTVA